MSNYEPTNFLMDFAILRAIQNTGQAPGAIRGMHQHSHGGATYWHSHDRFQPDHFHPFNVSTLYVLWRHRKTYERKGIAADSWGVPITRFVEVHCDWQASP